jgi:hypothetical protein
MHESDPVIEHQHLVLDSPRISGSQFEQHILDQFAVTLRVLVGREVS